MPNKKRSSRRNKSSLKKRSSGTKRRSRKTNQISRSKTHRRSKTHTRSKTHRRKRSTSGTKTHRRKRSTSGTKTHRRKRSTSGTKTHRRTKTQRRKRSNSKTKTHRRKRSTTDRRKRSTTDRRKRSTRRKKQKGGIDLGLVSSCSKQTSEVTCKVEKNTKGNEKCVWKNGKCSPTLSTRAADVGKTIGRAGATVLRTAALVGATAASIPTLVGPGAVIGGITNVQKDARQERENIKKKAEEDLRLRILEAQNKEKLVIPQNIPVFIVAYDYYTRVISCFGILDSNGKYKIFNHLSNKIEYTNYNIPPPKLATDIDKEFLNKFGKYVYSRQAGITLNTKDKSENEFINLVSKYTSKLPKY